MFCFGEIDIKVSRVVKKCSRLELSTLRVNLITFSNENKRGSPARHFAH